MEDMLTSLFSPTYPVLFWDSLHLVVEEEVHSQRVASFVSEHRAQNLTVFVAHFLCHVEQNRVVDLLNVDPESYNKIF